MAGPDAPDGSSDPTDAADSPLGNGPVGHGGCVVGEGDCLFSIAYEAGHSWETLWNLGDNAELKRVRESPNLLLVGDRVTVPPITVKRIPDASDARYTFKRKNVPAKLLLHIIRPPDLSTKRSKASSSTSSAPLHVVDSDPDAPDPQTDEPWANVPYSLQVEGTTKTGNANGQGNITLSIMPNARSGVLCLDPDGTDGGPRNIPLNLGALAPHNELIGIKQRLLHLGFDPGDTDNQTQSDAFLAAVAAFREKNGMGSGGLDQPFIDKLKVLHGS